MDVPLRHNVDVNVPIGGCPQDYTGTGRLGDPSRPGTMMDPPRHSILQDCINPGDNNFITELSHHSVPQDNINPGRFGNLSHHDMVRDPLHHGPQRK